MRFGICRALKRRVLCLMRRFPLNELAVDRHKLQIFGFVASSLPIISSYLWYLAWLVLAIASRVKSSWLEPVDTDALWELRKSHNDHQIPRRPWCIVTGGASGVGREACIMLAHRGLQVVIADKNVEEAHRTAECINEIFSSDTAEAHELDLANVDSIKAFVRRITVSEQCSMAAARYNADRESAAAAAAQLSAAVHADVCGACNTNYSGDRNRGPLVLLVNNAGIMPTGSVAHHFRHIPQGLAVNAVGPALLTLLLLPHLARHTPHSGIVFTGSFVHPSSWPCRGACERILASLSAMGTDCPDPRPATSRCSPRRSISPRAIRSAPHPRLRDRSAVLEGAGIPPPRLAPRDPPDPTLDAVRRLFSRVPPAEYAASKHCTHALAAALGSCVRIAVADPGPVRTSLTRVWPSAVQRLQHVSLTLFGCLGSAKEGALAVDAAAGFVLGSASPGKDTPLKAVRGVGEERERRKRMTHEPVDGVGMDEEREKKTTTPSLVDSQDSPTPEFSRTVTDCKGSPTAEFFQSRGRVFMNSTVRGVGSLSGARASLGLCIIHSAVTAASAGAQSC